MRRVPVGSFVVLFVLALLVIVMVRFNAKANPVPTKTSHNTMIEVIWTVVPVLILVGIGVIPNTELAEMSGLAVANGIDAAHFDAVFDTDALREETREDFRLSRRWGINGFPSLLAEQNGTLYQIGRGYAPSVALYARAVEVMQQHPAAGAE